MTLNILPVSANAYYRVAPRGNIYITEKGKKQKEFIHNFLFERNCQKIEGPVKLTIQCFFKDKRKHDIDNVLKPLIDCLKDVCFGDDDLIEELHIAKFKGSEENFVMICIEPIVAF